MAVSQGKPDTTPILADALIKEFQKAGVITETTSRVVIDATWGEILRVYCECYGSESVVEVCMGAGLEVIRKAQANADTPSN